MMIKSDRKERMTGPTRGNARAASFVTNQVSQRCYGQKCMPIKCGSCFDV